MPEIRISPPSDELTPGNPTRIPIVVVIDQPLKVRGVHAKFHGAEETKATYSTYNAATKTTTTHTAVEHVDIVKSEYVLSGREQKGAFGNVTDAFATLFGGGDHDVLQPGEYPFEIEVRLPDDARDSFEGKKCRVFYELLVWIDIPVWPDTKAEHSFSVRSAASPGDLRHGPVRTRYPDDQQQGFFDSLFGPDITVEAAVADGAVREGDTIEGLFVIESSKPLSYRSISVRLVASETTKAKKHSDGYRHLGESLEIAKDGEINGKYTAEIYLPVVNPGGKTAIGSNFSIDCFMQIELDVPWAKNPKIRVPVTLL